MSNRNVQNYSENSRLLLSMQPGDRHDWPMVLSNDIRPRISYFTKKGFGKWKTYSSNDKSKILVYRIQ